MLGLRFLAEHDWKEFFESVSLVDAVLREDPAAVYSRMDFATRDSYRKAVERLARGSDPDELSVARATVEWAGEADAESVHRHIGYHLVDEGIEALETRIGYQVPLVLRLRRLGRRHALIFYLLGVLGLTATLTAIAAGIAGAADVPVSLVAVLAVVALTPASAMAVGICNYVASLLISPRVLPKLDADRAISAGHETLVVVPSLLADEAEIRDLLHDLEVNYLGTRDRRLHFALLTDLSDADRVELPDDERLVELASAEIRSLNRRHGVSEEDGPFHLLHRPRRWNSSDRRWMGWERKRGKIAELNRLLLSIDEGAPELEAFSIRVGNIDWLRHVAFVITLDADTFLPPGSAARLVAAMAHPLNRARFSRDGRVEAGCTVLQPRVEVHPQSGNRTAFARIFTGDRGLDLYNSASSDLYQDLFGEGNFAGKGIYEPAAFERSLAGRAPENRLLSHDLFEGIHGRAGLVSDVLVLEDSPVDFLTHALRTHRWIRGDWQLLPWLLPRVPGEDGECLPNVLSVLDRWKILDNLRRSLLAPFLLLMLAGGWALLPGVAWLWTLLAAAAVAVPVLLTATIGLQRTATARPWIPLLRSARHSLRVDFQRWLLTLAFLPHEALMSVDAIARTLWRLTISKRRLLEWTTAARTARDAAGVPRRLNVWFRLASPPLIAVGLAVLLGLLGSAALWSAAPLLLLWALAPELAVRTAREFRGRIAEPPGEEEIRRLRDVAHRTWQFFERTVTAEDHWLPPDHYQEEPRDYLARRTSPTNMGMLLLSTAAAWDLGYLTTSELAARIGNTLGSMDGLRRHRGHLFNWYDTATREVLLPEYVSTVDSGNLAASLVVLQHACMESPGAPVIRAAHTESLVETAEELCRVLESTGAYDRMLLRHHVHDTCANLRQELATHQGTAQRVRWVRTAGPRIVNRLGDTLIALADARPRILAREELARLRIAAEAMAGHLDQLRSEIDGLLPWLANAHLPPSLFRDPERPDLQVAWTALANALEQLPTPRQFPDFAAVARGLCGRLGALLDAAPCTDSGARAATQEAREWLRRLAESVDQGERRAAYLTADLENLAGYCRDMVDDMDFGFLLDRHRGVFHLGYNATDGTLDGSYYDLLASEARLASFLAIAKGDVQPDHWQSLGRPYGRVDGTWTLLSWSGTSFEYLMPSLFMDTPPRTLLGRSCDVAVQAQISFASRHGVPWGISESSYNEFDAESGYRYRAFGIPDLGLAASLGERLVISPYASMLALPFRPRRVLENLELLVELGCLGRYGMFEAVDFGSTIASPPRTRHVVRSYMAHHQGMILAAITNRLCDGSLQRRFQLDRRVHTGEPLVHERLPDRVPARKVLPRGGHPGDLAEGLQRVEPWLVEPHRPCSQLNLLSNGRMRALVTASGGGATWWESVAVTPWSPDAALGSSGHWIYLRDLDEDTIWSVGSEPTGAPWDDYEVTFGVADCEIMRRSHGILARMHVTLAPDEDIEVRHLELHNETANRRRLQVTGCAEVLLAPDAEARRHLAFAKLFVESSFDAERGVLLFRRRPKSAGEAGLHLAHAVDVVKGRGSGPWYETDRERFFGRLGSAARPAGLTREEGTTGSLGAPLDPVMVMGREVEIPPRATVTLVFLTAVGRSRQAVVASVERYRSPGRAGALGRRARQQGEHDLYSLGIPGADASRLQQLASALLFPRSSLRAPKGVLASNGLGQRDLWRFGISGDAPILLVTAKDVEAGSFVEPLIRGHARWLRQGLLVDLVILDDTASWYARPLRDRIRATLEKISPQSWSRSPGGVHLIERDKIGPGERILLESTARVVLRCNAGPLEAQLAEPAEVLHELPRFVPVPSSPVDGRQEGAAQRLDPPTDLIERSDYGGFTGDGREYVIHLNADRHTPAPWANVIANPEFGCLVTESGGGFTWALNSSENRLTTWHNDPVLDPPSEVVYLRDEETGRAWSATPEPRPGPAPYQVRHGAGYTTFRHVSHGVEQELQIYVDPDDPVKIVRLRVRDLLGRPRRLTATYYVEWVLGSQRADSALHVIPEYDPETGALLVRNPFHADTAERVAFLAASRATHGVTADRLEFLGSPGSLRSPAALERVGLSGRVEPGGDACGVLQVHLDVEADSEIEVHFLLGQASDRNNALNLVRRFQPAAAAARARQRSDESWDALLGAVTVETPDAGMNVLLNRWLLYQATACRMWARTGLYQASGAFGFRDQLQDSLALLWSAPERVREHLLRAAAQQFSAGDVLHWWHPPGGHGVRTRCSDDLLWLPFVTAAYVRATGDATVLDERIPFLVGEPLEDGEHERYASFESGEDVRPLYEHCLRAMRRGTTAGAHGLPLIGSGDWNDGLSRVGIEGRGESVWLGWFLHSTLRGFAPLCEERGDPAIAAQLREDAAAVCTSLEESAWDGEWYRRAYFDDGTPLGSSDSPECRIDLTAQTWAVLSGGSTPERQRLAMQSVDRLLVQADDRLILLLTPPFDKAPWDPGYIKGYPPGVRENGGQYTHAATWAAWAFAELGDGDRAWRLFDLLNPLRRHDSPEDTERYRVEPYVLAGDVYGAPPHVGRGGWTWYTGSASWMYRLGIEAILGLRLAGEGFVIDPRIPARWPGFQAVIRHDGARYELRVDNTAGTGHGVVALEMDGEALTGERIPWKDDGAVHRIAVRLG